MPSFHQDSTAAIASCCGISPKVLNQLQYIQNSAARLLTHSCDHINSVLHRQPRLSVPPAAFNSNIPAPPAQLGSSSVTLLTVASVLQIPTFSLHHSEPGVTAAGTHSPHTFKDASTQFKPMLETHLLYLSFKFVIMLFHTLFLLYICAFVFNYCAMSLSFIIKMNSY